MTFKKIFAVFLIVVGVNTAFYTIAIPFVHDMYSRQSEMSWSIDIHPQLTIFMTALNLIALGIGIFLIAKD